MARQSKELTAAATTYADVTERIKRLEKEKSKARGVIEASGLAAVRTEDGRAVTRRDQKRESVDLKAAQADPTLGPALRAFMRVTEYSTFSVVDAPV